MKFKANVSLPASLPGVVEDKRLRFIQGADGCEMMNTLQDQVKTTQADQSALLILHAARMKWSPLLGGFITIVELLSSLYEA